MRRVNQWLGSAIDKTNDIIKYCNTYHEWVRGYNKAANEQERKSKALYNWLVRYGFYEGKLAFKYSDIYIKDTSLYDILYRLYSKYSHNIRGTYDNLLSSALEVIDFCNKYNRWPKSYNNPQNEMELESNKCNLWLQRHGLYRGKSTFEKLKNNPSRMASHGISENTISKMDEIIEMIDSKYQEYKDTVIEEFSAINLVLDIEAICKKTNKWVCDYKQPQSEIEKESRKLYNRLYSESYLNPDGTFKYYDVILDSGELLGDRLNDIARKYKSPDKRTNEYVIYMVNKICEYARLYQEWPKMYPKTTNKHEKYCSSLYSWLKRSGYPDSFKYKNIVDINGINIYEVLKSYELVYGKKSTVFKSDTTISSTIYMLILKIKHSLDVSDKLGFDYYRIKLDSILKDNNIKINLDMLINLFNIDETERLVLIEKLSEYAKISNNEVLMEVFDKLYNYTFNTNNKVTYDSAKKYFLAPSNRGKNYGKK